jgi:hypothetical protein
LTLAPESKTLLLLLTGPGAVSRQQRSAESQQGASCLGCHLLLEEEEEETEAGEEERTFFSFIDF